jgi:hypothetical protein
VFLLTITVYGLAAEGETVNYSALNTLELMTKIQASLTESLRVLSELNIQAPPQKVGERRRFKHQVYFLEEDWKARIKLEGKARMVPSVRYIEVKCVKIIKKTAYIYIEVGYDDKFEEEVKHIAKSFPKEQKRLIKFFGPPSFDVDLDPAVYFLISPTAFSHDKPGITAKVSLTDTDLSFPNSNGAEIMYIKPYSVGGMDVRNYMGFEYTHILSISHDWDDQIWVHEGLGYVAVRILGYLMQPYHRAAPDNFLNWRGTADNHISVCYFFLFIYDHYGLEVIRRILADPYNGKDSISRIVGKSWDELWSEYKIFLRRGPIFTRPPPK